LKTNRVSLQNFPYCNCGVVFGGKFGRSGIRQGELVTWVGVVFEVFV
jgi:hypothetical protein